MSIEDAARFRDINDNSMTSEERKEILLMRRGMQFGRCSSWEGDEKKYKELLND